MEVLCREVETFKLRAAESTARTGATIALQLLCSEDLNAVLAGGDAEKRRVTRKLRHQLERERQRGLRGHWSYDLNRHIGLRQALDLINGYRTTSKLPSK